MRGITYEPACETSISNVFNGAQEADARLNGIEWALARETTFSGHLYPAVGKTQDGSIIRVCKSIGTQTIPSLLVVFSISKDDSTVILYDVCLAASDPPKPPRSPDHPESPTLS